MILALSIRKSWIERLDFKLLLIISFGIFSAITGKNIGYEGRMFVGCLPLFLLIITDSFKESVVNNHFLHINYGTINVRLKTTAISFFVVLLALFATHAGAFNLTMESIKKISAGGYYQQKFPNFISDYLKNTQYLVRQSNSDDYGVTPYNFKMTGIAVDEIRSILELRSIDFMVPDVGGIGLCCPKIRVIDSALLTNRFLAKNGYSKFEVYLKETFPDIIETHATWSIVSNIYKSEFFGTNYEPIIFQNNLLWIRNDHLASLLQSPKLLSRKLDGINHFKGVRYYNHKFEVDFFTHYNKFNLWVFEFNQSES